MTFFKTLEYSYIRQGGVRFDILKFVLAMLIVAMHSSIFPRWLLPLPRLAVPLFFMMTSYFFHLKLKDVIDNNERKQVLAKYVKRNIQLYLFWCVVFLPCVLLLHYYWFEDGVVAVIFNILKSFFITGFFAPASWFILSSIYAVAIVFVLSKWCKNGWIFFIALLVYIVALLDSNYGGLLSEEARNQLNIIDIRWSLNLPAAMVWVVIGKMLAEKPVIFSTKLLYLLLIIAAVLYCLEFVMIEHYGWSIHTDCFLMSIPLCTLIFIAMGQSDDVKCKYALWLRKSSIIIYCVHQTTISMLRTVSFYYCLGLSELSIFIITLFISISTAAAILYFSEKKGIKLLRYAY